MTTTDEDAIRQILNHWFEATAAKDIDGVMTNIADNIVSYEHDTPLQYVGRYNVREVCQRGFDMTNGDVTWTVPDTSIIVVGDLAVQWGLNQMCAQEPGQPPYESWSRGTRIFRRINGEWIMIHQHVSYPYDPETNEAKTQLQP